MLVSAVAIFGAFQLFTIVEWMTNQFLDFLHPEQYQLGFYIGVSAMIAVSVLVCMFIIHFEFYQNQNSEMKLLIAPELISDVVSDSVMQLFIPVLSNESRRIKTGKCGSLAQQGETRKQRRRQENQQTVDCYRHYHKILLNGVEQNAQLLRSNHRRTKQRGVTTYISLEQANIGANTLTIVKAFDDEQVSWSIPFQYAPSSR